MREELGDAVRKKERGCKNTLQIQKKVCEKKIFFVQSPKHLKKQK